MFAHQYGRPMYCQLFGGNILIDFCYIWKFNMTAMPVMLSDWLKFQKKILRSESKMDAKAEVLTWLVYHLFLMTLCKIHVFCRLFHNAKLILV
jgi:hypothetical protein